MLSISVIINWYKREEYNEWRFENFPAIHIKRKQNFHLEKEKNSHLSLRWLLQIKLLYLKNKLKVSKFDDEM